jgi:hypothetical protein
MPIFLKDNHQLESRMREIRQSGSEGGAKRTFVPTPIDENLNAICTPWKKGQPSFDLTN